MPLILVRLIEATFNQFGRSRSSSIPCTFGLMSRSLPFPQLPVVDAFYDLHPLAAFLSPLATMTTVWFTRPPTVYIGVDAGLPWPVYRFIIMLV